MHPTLPGRLHFTPLLIGLGRKCQTSSFRKNQTIFAAGDPSHSVYFIERGSVKLVVTSAQGREAVVSVIDEGNFFGENALDISPEARSHAAVALTQVRAARIAREVMLSLIDADPDVCHTVLSSLIRMNTRFVANLSDNLLYSSEIRLARALVAITTDEHDCAQPSPRMTQQDLANMIGVTRQRVNFLLRRFQKFGLIDYDHGKVIVHDPMRDIAAASGFPLGREH